MKKRLSYLLPFVFAVLSFFFYIILYNPTVPSGDFITALLLFFSALGCGAIVIFSKNGRRGTVYIYVIGTVILLLLTLLVFKESCDTWHMVLLGLIVLGLAWLKVFAASHFEYERRNKK